MMLKYVKMKPILMLLIASITHLSICQTKFGGVPSGSSEPGDNSSDIPNKEDISSANTRASENPSTNTRFFTGDDKLDAGLIGAAAGIGATLLGTALLGGNNNNGCGRRRRQAEGGARFFLPSGGGNNCNNPCGRRRRRQVKEGEEVGTRGFLGGLFGGPSKNNNCGQFTNTNSFSGSRPTNNGFNPNNGFNNNRPTNNGFNSNNGFNNNRPINNGFNPNNGFNNNRPTNGFSNNRPTNNGFNTNRPSSNGFNNNRPTNSGFSSGSGRCECTSLSLIQNGREHAKCQRPDETNRIWCYTTSTSRCNDAKQSSRYPSNPWSYRACSFLSSSTNVAQFGRSAPKTEDDGKDADNSSGINF